MKVKKRFNFAFIRTLLVESEIERHEKTGSSVGTDVGLKNLNISI